MGVSKNRDTPKWMVKILENPIKMGWFGGKTHYFRKHPYVWSLTLILLYRLFIFTPRKVSRVSQNLIIQNDHPKWSLSLVRLLWVVDSRWGPSLSTKSGGTADPCIVKLGVLHYKYIYIHQSNILEWYGRLGLLLGYLVISLYKPSFAAMRGGFCLYPNVSIFLAVESYLEHQISTG